MKNRGILARQNAKSKGINQKVIKKPKKVPQPKVAKGILLKDPESGDVVKEYESVEQAIKDGFNAANINIALKRGTKYKGHLWETK